MSFSSVSFIVFMFAVFLIYWGIPHKFRYLLLIFANLLFYCSFGTKYFVVLIIEVLFAYVFAKVLENKHNKAIFCVGITLLVLPLLIFKYLNFAFYTIDKVLSRISVPVEAHTLKLIAPIGISFYTFELLSYIIDVYNGKTKAENNILRLFVFAGFFPNITSGPIERAGKFLPQLDIEKKFDYDSVVYGYRLVLLGLFKKICAADVLKQYVDSVFGNIYAYKGPTFIIAIILYTYEIYLDFSGYTDMARGFAAALGFELSQNFKAPYLSCGIKEFFARWHISLSQWLRDYIYIPLGGSRCSKLRKYINLIVTFFVSGLWHGASFTFIVWGLLHGVYQCMADMISSVTRGGAKIVNREEKDHKKAGFPVKVCKILVTFLLVSFAWMFFRANSLSDAKYIAMNMIFGDNFYGQMLKMGFLKTSAYVSVALIIILTIVYDVVSERLSNKGTDVVTEFAKLNTLVRWLIYIIAGIMIVVLRSHIGTSNDFIYFKF